MSGSASRVGERALFSSRGWDWEVEERPIIGGSDLAGEEEVGGGGLAIIILKGYGIVLACFGYDESNGME